MTTVSACTRAIENNGSKQNHAEQNQDSPGASVWQVGKTLRKCRENFPWMGDNYGATIADCVDSKSIETSNREMLDLYDDEDDDENDREFIVNELDGTVDPYVGMEFESEEAAMVYYDAYAKRVGFIIRVGNCHRSGRDGSVISRRFLCNKEGFRVSNKKMKRLEVRKPREITREGCRAMIMVRKDKSGKWIVTKLETEHCHPLGIPTGKGRRGSVQARPQVSLLLYSVFSAV